jgi:outer membrane scaffolding protein for murein synthesis (MipA/OmpV family)
MGISPKSRFLIPSAVPSADSFDAMRRMDDWRAMSARAGTSEARSEDDFLASSALAFGPRVGDDIAATGDPADRLQCTLR